MSEIKIGSNGLFDEFSVELHEELNDLREIFSDNLDLVTKSIDMYSKEIRKEIIRRKRIIHFAENELKGGWTKKQLEPILQRIPKELMLDPPSWRILASWKKEYFESGRSPYALIPKHEKKGNKNRLLSTDHLVDEAITKKYLTRERLSIAEAYRYYKSRVIQENKRIPKEKLQPLTEGAFRHRIKLLSPYDVAAGRYGKKYADREFRSVGEMIPATYPYEFLEIDHTPLPVILIDDKLDLPLGRPHLTMLFDRYTKCIVGFSLNFREPSFDSVRKALANAMLSKSWIKQKYPKIENDWPCEGKIDNLVVDNGAEFWSQSLEESLKPFVTNIQYNPAAKPWRKAGIEKSFDQLNKGLINSLKGKTFTNPTQLKDYDPKKEAVVCVSEFLELLHIWIIDYYHMTSDSKERHIPYFTWKEAAFKPQTYNKHDELQIKIELGIYRERVIGIAGIKLHNIRYQSDELIDFRKYLKSNSKQNTYVKTKTDPSDISAIYVWIPHKNQYIKVPTVNEKIRSLKISLFELKVAIRVARLNTRKKVNEEAIADTYLYLHDRIESTTEKAAKLGKNQSTKVSDASQQAKFRDVGSQGTTSIQQSPDTKINDQIKDTPKEINLGDDIDLSRAKRYKNSNK